MAARTVEAGYFGAVGHGDPMCAFTEKTLVTSWDFSKTNVPENKTIPIMQIPKGFCIDRVSVVQREYADQSLALTFGLKSDNTVAVGGTFTLAASSTMLRASQPATSTNAKDSAGTGTVAVGSPLFVNGDDVLCMIMPSSLTNDKCAAGAFDIAIHGFSTFAEAPAENKTGNEVFRPTMQTQDNVAGPRFPLD
jgi:hypothetical protein